MVDSDGWIDVIDPNNLKATALLMSFIGACAKGWIVFGWQHAEMKIEKEFWKERSLRAWDMANTALNVALTRSAEHESPLRERDK